MLEVQICTVLVTGGLSLHQWRSILVAQMSITELYTRTSMLSPSQRNTVCCIFLKSHFRNVAKAWLPYSLEKAEVVNIKPHCFQCGLRKRHQFHELAAWIKFTFLQNPHDSYHINHLDQCCPMELSGDIDMLFNSVNH